MSYILAIDEGTSSTRAIIYDLQANVIAVSQYPITLHYPHPGWVEQDPEELWQKTLMAVLDVVKKVEPKSILACGITNQRETTLIWNKKTGACLSPAIVWQDRRTADFCTTLTDASALIQQKTGLLPDPYFSASKVHWLLQNNQEAQQLAAQGCLAFGTVDSFLIWRLTDGQHLTDVTNASRTLLFDINKQGWDDELLRLFSIPQSILPEVRGCDAHFGMISKKHLGFEIPITGVAGDQQAALVGQNCMKAGMIKATFGTGAFLLLNTGELPVYSKNKLLTTIAYSIQGKVAYGLEGSIYNAGTTVKWLRDELQLIKHAEETETLAQSLHSNEGVYLVSSFEGLGAPHWISKPGALISGLTHKSNRAHIARAALEGVCYQTKDVLHAMQEDSQLVFNEMRVDGGMSANGWFLQFLANQCQLVVQKPVDIELTSKGVAMIAAIGCGALDIMPQWAMHGAFSPTQDKHTAYQDYVGWEIALAKVLI